MRFSFFTTRSPRGARRVCGAIALLSAVLLPWVASGADDRSEALGPLPWRVGGRVGFTVDAAGFPDSAGYVLEVYVRIPPATIGSLVRDSTGVSRLRLEARLANAFGARQNSAVQELSLTPSDSTGGFGKVIVLSFPSRPGPQRLQVKLSDLHSRKHGIFYMGRNVVEASSADGQFEFPLPQVGRDLSDLEFAWSEDSSRASMAFTHAGHRIVPNPERLYGLFASDLRVFFVARGKKGDARPWRTVARISDPSGHVAAERESTTAAADRIESGFTIDLSNDPAGPYDLEVKAWQEGDSGALTRHARFSIAWMADSWFRNPRDVEDEVHFLLSSDDEEAFVKMSPGEQERFMEEFWRVRDPDPETAENEARTTFLKRVEYANHNYAQPGTGRGMFCDMGRVFIRYGEPSEILRQVIPSGDNTLRQILNELAISEDRPIDDLQQKGLGGDIRPFEVWIYEGEIPTPPDADPRVTPHVRSRRIVFLFVDEHGLGDFRLRYSTE